MTDGEKRTLRPRPWVAISRLFLIGGASSLVLVILTGLVLVMADPAFVTFRIIFYFVPGLVGLATYVLLRKGRISRAWWLGLAAGALAIIVAAVFLAGGFPFVDAVIQFFTVVQFAVAAPDWFTFEPSRTVVLLGLLRVLLQCAYLLVVIAGVWSLTAHFRGRHPRELINP